MNESSKRIALEELRSSFGRTWEASDILDGKLQNILNFSSIILAVASSVMGSTLLDRVGIIFWCLLLIAMDLYLIVFFRIMVGLTPKISASPISKNLKTLEEKYFNWPEDRALQQAIHDHLYYQEKLFEENSPKARAVMVSSYLMGAIVIILLIAIPVGLIWSTPTLPCVLHLTCCVTK